MPRSIFSRSQEELPYLVELWLVGAGAGVERVLGRAATMQLGRAIYTAAREEHPERRLTLRVGSRILLDAASSSDPVDA